MYQIIEPNTNHVYDTCETLDRATTIQKVHEGSEIQEKKYRIVSDRRSYGSYPNETYAKAYMNDLSREASCNYSDETFWIEEEVREVDPNKDYFFTFGSSPQFPFSGGYLIVRAQNEHEAREKYKKHYPNVHNNCLNCAFVYTEEEWATAENHGVCHRVIQ